MGPEVAKNDRKAYTLCETACWKSALQRDTQHGAHKMKHLLGLFLIAFVCTAVGCDNEDTTEETTTDAVAEENTEVAEENTEAAEENTEAAEEESEVVIVTTTDENGETYLDFMPQDLTIAVGTTVQFVMSNTHNAVEVSEETYNNRESTALEGGFAVQFGETKEVTFDAAGVHYYVCTPHVTMDMVGTITVE